MNQKQDISGYGKGYQIDADKIDHFGDSYHYYGQPPEPKPSIGWEHQPPSIDHWQGRGKELTQLNAWLAEETNHLIIVHGVGGFGKSTLAAKIHREKPGFADVFWADMSRRLTFAELARRVLQQFHSLPQKQVEEIEEKFLADVLLNCLRQERYLLVIDNLETLLHPSGEWQDIFYEQFFLRWLEYDSKSVLLVTTQERPKLPEIKPRWLKLLGLKSSEGAALLQALGIQGTQAELETFSEAVNGCPLTLKLVAGLLNMEEGENPPLSHLSKYGEALGVEGSHRRRKISTEQILEISLSRLSEKLRRLLFNLSVYRLPFDVAAAVAQLPGEEVTERDLKELERRSLLQMQRDGGGELRFQFQPMILNYARRKAGDLTKTHLQAIYYYLLHTKEKATWQTLDDLREWLELFHHWCELKEYDSALYIVDFCHSFLDRRGYPNKQIELFQQSLAIFQERGDRVREAISLNSLGNASQSLGQYREAISFHEQSLAIACKIGDRDVETASMNNLGSVYGSLGQYRKAIEFCRQSLAIFQEIGDLHGQAISFGILGNASYCLGQYEEAITFFEQSLEICGKIDDLCGEASSLNGLGNVYKYLGQYETAITFYEKSAAIFHKTGALRGEASSSGNLGSTFYCLGQDEKAISLFEKSLNIFREIEALCGEATCLIGLGHALAQINRESEAVQVFQKARDLFQAIGLEQEAEECDTAIQNISKVVTSKPVVAATPQPAPRRRRRRTLLQRIRRWFQSLWRLLRILFRRR